jgi:sterol 3beta-glucosyltransferase
MHAHTLLLQIDITGNFFAPPKSISDYQPPAELVDWLAKGDAPIFIGFGSMVIADTAALVKTVSNCSTASIVVLAVCWRYWHYC